MIENSFDIVALLDKNGVFTYITPSIKKNLGYHPKELTGKSGFAFLHPDDIAKAEHILTNILKHPNKNVTAEIRFLHKDSSWRLLEVRAVNMLHDRSVQAIICNFHDITAHKAAETLLTESEHKFRYLANYAPVMIWVTRIDGYCTYLNKKWYEFTGQTEKSGLGDGWLSVVHADDVEITSEMAFNAIKKQKPFNLTFRMLRKDGVYRWVISSGAPTFDHDGRIEGFIGSVIDIHDRIELEHKKDEFMSIASHELKTPMTTLKAYTQILQRKFQKAGDEETLQSLTKMDTQINKLTRLIVDLLDVSRIEAGKLQIRKKKIPIFPLIKETVETVQAASNAHTFILEGKTRSNVLADKDRLTQVLINLLNNAVKYSPHADKVHVQVSRLKDTFYIRVRDYGIGISKKQTEHIFDRFYQGSDTDQRRKTYPGLGIGLFIAQQIAKHHGGVITVESKSGKGSTFCLQLPVAVKKQKN